MAQAFARHFFSTSAECESAGLEVLPVNKLAVTVMNEFGIDISAFRSKSVSGFLSQRFDAIVVMTDSVRQNCPVFPGMPAIIPWNFDDQTLHDALRKQDVAVIRDMAQQIRGLVTALISSGSIDAIVNQRIQADMVLDSLAEGVIAHDIKRRIFLFSRGAERLTGMIADQALGRNCQEVFPHSFCGAACAASGDCVDVSFVNRQPYTTTIYKSDKSAMTIGVTRLPLTNADGALCGVVLALNDKTGLKRHIQQQLAQSDEYHGIIGCDYKMQLVFDLIRDLSDSDFSVVISGESGTGKELVARAIHAESRRANKLFVPVNCGALPEGTLESELFGHVRGSFTGAIRDKKGRFELADGGTMFLDEVGELPLSTQVKLLRVLQEGTFDPVGDDKPKKVDVRIICATNRDLKEQVDKGAFREDLYYRLAVVPLELPPLRDRKNDITLLATRFLTDVAKKIDRSDMTLSPDALAVFSAYKWPGNVRQLQNAIQYALVKCKSGAILPPHLPPEITAAVPVLAVDDVDNSEHKRVGRKPKLSCESVAIALTKSGNNKAKAARMLGVGRATLYNFMNENNIPVSEDGQ